MYTTIVLVIWHPHLLNTHLLNPHLLAPPSIEQILPYPDIGGSGGISEKVLIGHHSKIHTTLGYS